MTSYLPHCDVIFYSHSVLCFECARRIFRDFFNVFTIILAN